MKTKITLIIAAAFFLFLPYQNYGQTTCTDKILSTGNDDGPSLPLGGPDPYDWGAVAQSFEDFTGQITRVDFIAQSSKMDGSSSTIRAYIFSTTYNAGDDTWYASGSVLGSVDVIVGSSPGEYGANFSAPVNVSNGFSILLAPKAAADSIYIHEGTNNSSSARAVRYRNDNFIDGQWSDYAIRPTIRFSLNATFTATPNPACLGQNVKLEGIPAPSYELWNNYLYGNVSETYNFGDGTTDTNPYISYQQDHTYSTAGSKSTSYKAEYIGWTNVCSVTKSLSLTVVGNPTAGFNFTTNNLDANFTNTSTNATTYSWNFGDLNTSNLQNPTHTYSSAGTYVVELTATNACFSQMTSQSLTVSGTTSITENTETVKVNIYPNPASSALSIDYDIISKNSDFEVQIFNSIGKLMNSYKLGNSPIGKIMVDLSQYSAGAYFIKVHGTDLNMVKPFVKE